MMWAKSAQANRRVVLLAGLLALSPTLSGCLDLFALFGAIDTNSNHGQVTASVSVSDGFKDVLSNGIFLSCFNALLAEAKATEINIFQAAMVAAAFCRDPLLVEVPNAVSNLSGTATLGPNTEALDITGPFPCVDTQPGQQICARPGRSIYVLDGAATAVLPPGSSTIDLAVDFTMTPPAAFDARLISTAKIVTTANDTYYPVLFPCVSDFSDALVLNVPAAGSLQQIGLDFTGAAVCGEKTINLLQGGGGGSASAPVLGALGAAFMTLGLMFVGRYVLRRR